MRVQTYGFALDEAILFLDTHPNDESAMNYYHETLKLYNMAVRDYVTNFGPLEATHVHGGKKWTWATDNLPWEAEHNVEI